MIERPDRAKELNAARVVHIGPHELIQGDCLEVMPALGEVDAVVTDPPYGIGGDGRKQAELKSASKLAPANLYKAKNWDGSIQQEAIDQALVASRYAVVFGGNYYDLPPSKCWLVWDKAGPANDFADCELAWTNLNKSVRRLRFLWNGCMRLERHIERQHPTQKPVGVMKWCIEHLPNDSKTILDPFMGSGTTGVACQQLGRQFIGIEKDPAYFEIACKRVAEAHSQPSLFEEPAPKKIQNGNLFDEDAA